jgi:hypothetical protein
MEPKDELSRANLSLLIGRSEADLKNDIQLGNLLYWNQPIIPRQFIAIDAVLSVLFQQFCKQFRLQATAVRIAAPGMQLTLPDGVDRPRTEMMIALNRNNTLSVGCGTEAELDKYGLFKRKKFPAHFRVPVAMATNHVREIAKQHNIELPKTFAPGVLPFRVRGLPAKYLTPDGKTLSVWTPDQQFAQLPREIVN